MPCLSIQTEKSDGLAEELEYNTAYVVSSFIEEALYDTVDSNKPVKLTSASKDMFMYARKHGNDIIYRNVLFFSYPNTGTHDYCSDCIVWSIFSAIYET